MFCYHRKVTNMFCLLNIAFNVSCKKTDLISSYFMIKNYSMMLLPKHNISIIKKKSDTFYNHCILPNNFCLLNIALEINWKTTDLVFSYFMIIIPHGNIKTTFIMNLRQKMYFYIKEN